MPLWGGRWRPPFWESAVAASFYRTDDILLYVVTVFYIIKFQLIFGKDVKLNASVSHDEGWATDRRTASLSAVYAAA